VEEVTALVVERHPDRVGRERIDKGVGCVCAVGLSPPGVREG
jgi:hypothetical protein